jgi:hypothetical protein
MHRQTLELREKVLSPGHPNTLIIMNNLTAVPNSQDKYEAAEEMQRRMCLAPSTLTRVNDLIVVLNSHGKCGSAKEMQRREL